MRLDNGKRKEEEYLRGEKAGKGEKWNIVGCEEGKEKEIKG